MKTAIALALAGVALLVPATASAQPPTKVPPPPEPYTINLTDQDTPCGAFTLLVHGPRHSARAAWCGSRRCSS